ncbi:hypothetical protein C9374_008678 [Naegleria lovaniensis]|uniref:Eukaryotic peptide chain release factor subunit 1 n=1 Tax=Naegleria lovaniensis TaxID=51637 RepID=A0AA88KHC8_NAELO|nr:uncharacterized protein C9374_008678 [Naegleria lovaniensis]KAG2378056.1 hypothetical protein C9374_008678 [Naegleria lovaniensis]
MVNPQSVPTLLNSNGNYSLDGNDHAEDYEACSNDSNNVDLKKLFVMIEPPLNSIKSNLYYCDDCFHVEQLREQLQDFTAGKKYGVIVITGHGALFGTCRGNTHSIMYQFSVDLPKKHSKGGQSRERFARNREIAKNEYLKQIAEKANALFISQALNAPNVDGLVLAGSADLKNELISLKSDVLDYRLRTKILSIVDVAYGGKAGFYQAISLAQEAILDAKYIEERECIEELFNLMAKGNKVAVGLDETMYAINAGWVDKLIICETQNQLKKVTFADSSVKYLREKDLKDYGDSSSIVKVESLLDYLIDNYEKLGINSLNLVSSSTNEGNMFVTSFEGIGCMLKFDVNVAALLAEENGLNESSFENHAFDEDLADFY